MNRGDRARTSGQLAAIFAGVALITLSALVAAYGAAAMVFGGVATARDATGVLAIGGVAAASLLSGRWLLRHGRKKA